MTHLTMRETFRLVVVAFGVLNFVVGFIWAFSLLSARTEKGVVEIHPMLEYGDTTNVAYVVWGGMHLRLEPGDSPAPLKAGDPVPVIAYGKGGTVKFGRVFWREWRLAGTFAGIGVGLIIVGFYVLRHQPIHSRIDATQAV